MKVYSAVIDFLLADGLPDGQSDSNRLSTEM
jgi:hypothetical protein